MIDDTSLRIRLLERLQSLHTLANTYRRLANEIDLEVSAAAKLLKGDESSNARKLRKQDIMRREQSKDGSLLDLVDVIEYLTVHGPTVSMTICEHFKVDGRQFHRLQRWAELGHLRKLDGRTFDIVREQEGEQVAV